MTIINDLPPTVEQLRRVHVRNAVDELDYRRLLRRAVREGFTQRQIADWLGLTQPTINKVLARAKDLPDPVDGFSGATPYEICQRYAAGVISRDQLLDELVRFPYVAIPSMHPEAEMEFNSPGTWRDVEEALTDGLIRPEDYDYAVMHAQH